MFKLWCEWGISYKPSYNVYFCFLGFVTTPLSINMHIKMLS